MYICKNCGMTYSSHARFCERCGSILTENYNHNTNPEPTHYSSPAYTTPSYSAYSPYEPVHTPSVASKILGIIGMALGIYNICMSLFSFITACTAIDTASYNSSYYYYGSSEIVPMFVFIFMMLVSSIVGLVLSSVSRNKGYVTGISKTGKVLGILSTVFNGISTFLAFIALTM